MIKYKKRGIAVLATLAGLFLFSYQALAVTVDINPYIHGSHATTHFTCDSSSSVTMYVYESTSALTNYTGGACNVTDFGYYIDETLMYSGGHLYFIDSNGFSCNSIPYSACATHANGTILDWCFDNGAGSCDSVLPALTFSIAGSSSFGFSDTFYHGLILWCLGFIFPIWYFKRKRNFS